ncbi:MAG: protein phosphatase 2C domain-containing protein, partial [Cyanobacteria bacterium P01_F01_bin.4]
MGLSKADPGTRLFSRYEVKRDQVVLDTQPGLIPESPAEFPETVLPYLALSAHSLHIPRPYALLQGEGSEILLLEHGAIAPTERDSIPSLLPALADQWQQVGPLRQLNWLWQIAQLWQPLEAEKVVGSLLSLPLLRVEGSIVRLMELRLDTQGVPNISDLGTAWQTLAETSHESVCEYLVALCERLRNQEFATAEILVASLDTAISTLGRSQGMHYEMAVQTDQGPVRQRNEDACYPDSGTAQVYPMPPNAIPSPLLVIVCDGIGGHQGGDVASRLAIAAIQAHLKSCLAQPDLDPVTITLAIEEAICVANDQISQRNDQEARQARDRMGTTLVMALALGPQLYVGHVGDSRAYRIGQRSCRQITLDDDVAAREVRLGYGFYREVVDHPGAGALVQALGMNASQSLYPNVQRLILDEDCLFVLCSDGLSDNDRVEQFWQTELLPVLQDRTSPAASTAALVQLANTYNGHDNVTISLLRSRITQPATHKVPVTAA